MSQENNSPAPTPEETAAAKAAEYRAKFEGTAGSGDPAPIEGGQEPAPEPPVKPEGVPDKFWNAETGEVDYESLTKSYTELEKRLHESPKDEPKEGETPAEGEQAEPAPLADLRSEAEAEFAQNQSLSDETYSKFEKAGITRDMIDTYIEGQTLKASALESAAYEAAGGSQENYAAMVQWASQNLSEAEQAAFNVQVDTGNPEVIKAAVSNLYSKYSETANVEGDRVGGTGTPATSTRFESRKQMADAINKIGEDGRRLYDTDPAYRNEVMRKIGNARKAGIAL